MFARCPRSALQRAPCTGGSMLPDHVPGHMHGHMPAQFWPHAACVAMTLARQSESGHKRKFADLRPGCCDGALLLGGQSDDCRQDLAGDLHTWVDRRQRVGRR